MNGVAVTRNAAYTPVIETDWRTLMPRKTFGPIEAVATYIGEDIADTKEREYQPGRTGPHKVFSWGDVYLFATHVDRKPSLLTKIRFPGCVIEEARGEQAGYVAMQGKRIWVIRQETASKAPSKGPWMVLSNSTETEWSVARKIETGNWATTTLEYIEDARGRKAIFRTEKEARTAIEVVEAGK